mmetsp:Transcript_25122/g.54828  ORF Transcript_25122/g.54828 Transcript_25122/m.54828 type:complete len:89 (+) Transcript_25122:3318-3584(+)
MSCAEQHLALHTHTEPVLNVEFMLIEAHLTAVDTTLSLGGHVVHSWIKQQQQKCVDQCTIDCTIIAARRNITNVQSLNIEIINVQLYC